MSGVYLAFCTFRAWSKQFIQSKIYETTICHLFLNPSEHLSFRLYSSVHGGDSQGE